MKRQERNLAQVKDDIYPSVCWDETNDQNKGYIEAVKEGEAIVADFPDDMSCSVYSAPNVGILNPYNSTPRRLYRINSDYDKIDLTTMPDNYKVRCRYRPGISMDEYTLKLPKSPWGRVTDGYRLISREFVGCDSERTLTCAIAPKAIAHVHAVFSLALKTAWTCAASQDARPVRHTIFWLNA